MKLKAPSSLEFTHCQFLCISKRISRSIFSIAYALTKRRVLYGALVSLLLIIIIIIIIVHRAFDSLVPVCLHEISINIEDEKAHIKCFQLENEKIKKSIFFRVSFCSAKVCIFPFLNCIFRKHQHWSSSSEREREREDFQL